MTEMLAGLPGEDASPEPVLTKADIEKLKSELTSEFEERAKGLQRLISDREEEAKALRTELQGFRNAGLSEEERERLEVEERDTRIGVLESENELLRLGSDYGDEMPFFQKLLSGKSAKEQLEVMREFAATFKPAAQVEPEVGDPEIPDVDLNRPLRQPSASAMLVNGLPMTDALADQILRTAGR